MYPAHKKLVINSFANKFMEQALLEAAINNDITGLENMLRSYPSNISQGPLLWLITACEKNSIEFVGEILRLRPEFASDESLGNRKAMHVSCEKGNAEIVEILAKRHPKLCLVKDQYQRSAVHIAAIGGKVKVLRALAKACPFSLTCVDSLKETGLHVALKNGQFHSFEVLFEELCKLNLKNVLAYKDCDGNTVLHIATSMKQTKILKLLLPDNGPMVDVNLKNHCGYRALDIHYQTNQFETSDKYISELLNDAAAKQAGACHRETSAERSNMVTRETFSLTKKAFLAAVYVFFVGGSFTLLPNVGSVYPLGNYGNARVQLSSQDMVFAPNQVPEVFIFILFTSSTFTLSMVSLLTVVFSLGGSWAFSFKLTMLILGSLTFATFALMAKNLVPHFKISFSGSSSISSFWLLCFCNLALIFLCAFFFLIKRCFSKVSTPINGRGINGRIV